VRRLAVLSALALAGCEVGPDYARPEVAAPTAWRDTPAEAESLANVPWWKIFGDPELQELIRIALEENKDLKIAAERVVEARARLGFTAADLYPRVDLRLESGLAQRSRDGLPNLPPGIDNKSDFYAASLDVFWELDVFGRIRRATEAERARLMSTEEGWKAVVLGLVSGVAEAYVELRDSDVRLEISRRTLASRAQSVDLARIRFEGQVTSEKDWRQAQAEYRRIESIVHEFERLVRENENRLSTLLGRNPGPLARGWSTREWPELPQVPVGLPSDLVENRPDLRAAEQNLVAANADIGQAKALLYPRIALTGSFGYESTDFDDLFKDTAKSWSIVGGLLQPIFNAGQNRSRVEIAESRMRQVLYAYEQSILLAFLEVENSLVGYRKAKDRRVSETARVEAERRVLYLSDLRYRGGVADYLEVLDAQRSLFSAELDEAAAIRDSLLELIRLYKSLGGGWPYEPEETAASEPAAAPGD